MAENCVSRPSTKKTRHFVLFGRIQNENRNMRFSYLSDMSMKIPSWRGGGGGGGVGRGRGHDNIYFFFLGGGLGGEVGHDNIFLLF